MKIENVPFSITDWSKISPQTILGESGSAVSRTFEQGNIRARYIEYSAGYKADHWCKRGHVAFLLEGDFTMEIEDGRIYELKKGMSFQVADDIDAHKARTENGAKVFIVD